MDSNFKYRKAFLIIAYGVLIQFLVLPIYEIPVLGPELFKAYVISKSIIALMIFTFIFCLLRLKLIKYWVIIFHTCCFSFVLISQFFNPGYHFAVIEYMFVSAIIFEGFPYAGTLLMALFMIEYQIIPMYRTDLPANSFHRSMVINALISSWIVSVAMERYVNRVKMKQGFLDRKLRYKGIKTDLFLHDLKNKLQPLVALYPDASDFKEIIKTIQTFNSFNDDMEMCFREVVLETKEKLKISGECTISGADDFFIAQMDLQTILSNLMINSQKVALERAIELHIFVKNTAYGFRYEDNAGGMTDEQFKFFSQKIFKPYAGHEKNGIGLLLVKKLVEHHEGKFLIKRTPNGMRFEINY
ncbi:MAG: hypothetical protein K2Q18_00715 [Bdellovibrionales bacterium]|nr:hypothetical protein [Bdellovibrionales bacterium]